MMERTSQSAAQPSLTIALSNAGANPLNVWLEPWAEECEIPYRGELSMIVTGDEITRIVPDVEQTKDSLVVWGTGGTRIEILINGELQDTVSAAVTSPDIGGLETKEFVNLVFGDHPKTRPGGRPTPTQKAWQILSSIFGRSN